MSVAFRRESDEEHKEPKFELPIPAGPNLVTARGLALIERRIEELDASIASGGEEAEIEQAKRELRYWSTRKTTAELAPVPDGEEVAFGTRVTLRLNGAERVMDIVGDDEADRVLAAQRLLVEAEAAQPVGARALEPAQVVGVVHDAGRVGAPDLGEGCGSRSRSGGQPRRGRRRHGRR